MHRQGRSRSASVRVVSPGTQVQGPDVKMQAAVSVTTVRRAVGPVTRCIVAAVITRRVTTMDRTLVRCGRSIAGVGMAPGEAVSAHIAVAESGIAATIMATDASVSAAEVTVRRLGFPGGNQKGESGTGSCDHQKRSHFACTVGEVGGNSG